MLKVARQGLYEMCKCAAGSCKRGVEARRLAPVGRGLSRRGQNKDTGIATTTY
jgi:hypothetical protein